MSRNCKTSPPSRWRSGSSPTSRSWLEREALRPTRASTVAGSSTATRANCSACRTSWEAHLRQARAWLKANGGHLGDRHLLDELATGFLNFFGAPAIAALHPDYESPARVAEIVKNVLDRIAELLAGDDAAAESLARFADEHGVRMMSIHKSKGLEFEAVVVMAVEHEMFWSDNDVERAAFFVGISRAKRQLLLTYARTRQWPLGARRWESDRTPYEEFLGYGYEPSACS